MKSRNHGRNISNPEVTQISTSGIWVLIKGEEFFLPYKKFPWFRNGTVSKIHNLQLLNGFHLRWPDLDIDLHVDSLRNVEKYPLVYLN